MTEVSVIIPVFNRARRVCRAVASVLEQTFKDYEIIVTDDASTDHTGRALERFGSVVKIITHRKNRGVSAARNTGIKASTGRFIALLDSDDYWHPEKLETQVSFFKENPGACICQGNEIWIRNGRRVNLARKHLKPSGNIFIPSLELCLVSPSAVMLKKSLFDETGLFDEDFPVCEDYDLWLRISSKYPVYLIEKDLLVKEGGHPDQLSASMKGMDRFRIKAMVKLLQGGELDKEQEKAVYKVLEKKCAIYGKGCMKRGRAEEGEYYLNLVKSLIDN